VRLRTPASQDLDSDPDTGRLLQRKPLFQVNLQRQTRLDKDIFSALATPLVAGC
jgi:hypothetical protein